MVAAESTPVSGPQRFEAIEKFERRGPVGQSGVAFEQQLTSSRKPLGRVPDVARSDCRDIAIQEIGEARPKRLDRAGTVSTFDQRASEFEYGPAVRCKSDMTAWR